MKSFGSEIEYDVTRKPIRLAVPLRIHEAIKRKFTVDYGLAPVSEEWGTDSSELIVFTFSESLDSAVFLRHLFTMTPEQYQELA